MALSISQILDRLTIESARTSPEPKKTNLPFKSVAAACWNQPNFLTHQELSLVPDPSTVMDPGLSRQACKHWRIWRWLWPTSFPIASSHLGNHPIYGEFGFAYTEYIYITIWQTTTIDQQVTWTWAGQYFSRCCHFPKNSVPYLGAHFWPTPRLRQRSDDYQNATDMISRFEFPPQMNERVIMFDWLVRRVLADMIICASKC